MADVTAANVGMVMERAASAAAIFSQLDQAQVDRIVRAVYEAGFRERIRLAKMAREETGLGRWQDKVMKNVLATQFVYEGIRDLRTVGIIREDERLGLVEIAQPIGPILAIVPVTNPTSTVLFKVLIAMKTRNPIIVKPHRRAERCSHETARVCYEAALKADAPEDCVQWLGGMSREDTQSLMSHEKMALILATGGGSLVKAAYSSGTPAIGVGAGNVPVYIEGSADVPFAVDQILLSKTFDNGTVCASEQAVVVEKAIAERVISEFKAKRAHFLSKAEIGKLEAVAFDTRTRVMRMEVIGQEVAAIAAMAGITVPEETVLLIAPLEGVGEAYPLSHEILAPILAFYVADDFDHALRLSLDLNYNGGIGHTASIFSNNEARIREFSMLMNAGRVCVNLPSSQGAVGGLFNTLPTSFTLGCGTGGKNITTDNITAAHLINIQRITRRRVNERFERFDKRLYFDDGLDATAIETVYNLNY
ncbi:MAG TPA: aldehyde dehydrogenase family protein [Verrucomicrobiae bacterium]|nr:aldehyde dehydrogenase family protein [Verrucomicrobiae bacterium]